MHKCKLSANMCLRIFAIILHPCTHVCVYVCVCVCVRACARARACVYVCVRAVGDAEAVRVHRDGLPL